VASKREALISSAEKSLQKGKVDLALKDYLKVLDETPNDINILNKIGDLQVRLGKPEESIAFFLRIAEHYARDGFYVRAIAMYKKINKLDPARLDIYEKLAELYVKQQLWMEAKSNYQVLADYLLKQDNLQGAIGIYQKMVAIEPQNLQLHVKLADLFTQGKRIPEALREYAVVAAALSERGAHEESIRVYEKALKLAPDNLEILKTLVPLLLSINSVEQARSALRKGLEASPRSVPLFLLAAEAALAANDVAEARSYSDKARAVDPENEEVLAAAVRIQMKGRRPDLAWAAAVPLAESALRRGEAKKALGILVPIARGAPDSEEIVKKVVDVAAGAGDETTALPFRSALAELYRKKGKLAEAADLLRHCARVQPDNAEFRARLAQIEPNVAASSVAPQRVPPPTIERNLEVTVSGFEVPSSREVVPPPAPSPPPSLPGPEAAAEAHEFEFDLDDAEMVEAVEEPVPEPASPPAPATPPRGLHARGAAAAPDGEPSWSSLSAAEALEAYEAREADAGRAASPPGIATPPAGVLREESEAAAEPVVSSSGFPPLDAALAPLPTFEPAPLGGVPSFPVPDLSSSDFPDVAWPSTSFPEAEVLPDEAESLAVSAGPVSRPAAGDAALEDALVEADVFRRYGLLEKAVDQLVPWLDRAPGDLRVREKLFEISLEQGHRETALEHAAVLADAYATEGREDRIRGLEGLLGESLRPAPEQPEEPAAPEAEAPPAAAAEVEAGEAEEAASEEALPEQAAPVEAAPEPAVPEDEVPSARVSPAPASWPAVATAPDEVAWEPEAAAASPPLPLPAALEEPLTEILAPLPTTPPVAAEVPPQEPPEVAGLEFEMEATGGPVGEPEPEEAFRALSALEPAHPATVGETSPSPEAPGAPSRFEESGPVPLAEAPPATEAAYDLGPLATPPPVAEPHRRPKPAVSAEELLGLAKPAAPSPSKKTRAVRPEELDLDLLGGRVPKAKGKSKAAPKESPALPDDLLKSLRKPTAKVPAPTPAPVPAAAEEPAPEEAVAAAPLPAEPSVEPAAEAELAPPVATPVAEHPSPDELSELDFCLDQGMVVDAAERLQSLEGRFPGDPELASRRIRLEGGRGFVEVGRAALHDILSDDLDSVLDAELGKALTEDMVRESPAATPAAPAAPSGAPVIDDSGLFSDEQEFFNFADELHTELKKEGESAAGEEPREVSLEEIFRDFKKGVEQQLSPEDYETHYNLGIAYKEMGLTDEAIGEFQLAAKDPLHAVECCAMLGLCFLEKGLPQLAVKWYRKGLETIGIKETDRLGLQYALAGVLEQIGDREGAYRTYLDIYGANAQFQDVAERIKALKAAVGP